MKKHFLVIALFMAGPTASASDELKSEIVCTNLSKPGEADNGLRVIIKSNPTSWVKRVSVTEIGFLGTREVMSIQIPLQPTVNFDVKSGWVLTYQTQNFQLSMKALSTRTGYQILGPAVVRVRIPTIPGQMSRQMTCKVLI